MYQVIFNIQQYYDVMLHIMKVIIIQRVSDKINI